MLRRSTFDLAVQSHQHAPTRVPHGRFSYGRNYTYSYRKYANGGWGLGTYSPTKDRRFFPAAFNSDQADVTSGASRGHHGALSRTTKTLSPHFRPFALADGGVLFCHPSQKEILTWTHDVLAEEQKASGMGNVHDEARNKIQAVIANNTIEHVSIAHWRNMHIRRLMRKTLQRKAGWATEINTSNTKIDMARKSLEPEDIRMKW